MEDDSEFKLTAEKLKKLGQKKMTREERKQRQRALHNLSIPSFLQVWKEKREEKGIKGLFLGLKIFFCQYDHRHV